MGKRSRRDGENIDVATVRGALVILRMWTEKPPWEPTTAEVAEYLGVEHSGAYRIMSKLSRPEEFAIYQDDDNRWRRSNGTH